MSGRAIVWRSWIIVLLGVLLTAAGCFSQDTRRSKGGGGGGGDPGEGEFEDLGGPADEAGSTVADVASDAGEPRPTCNSTEYTRGFAKGQQVQAIGFDDQDGARISLHRHCGEVVLLEVGSATCGVCEAALPDTIALHQRYQAAGLFIIYVLTANLAGVTPTEADLQEYRAMHSLPFPVVADRDGWLPFFVSGSQSIPIDILIDREQVIREVEGPIDRGYLAAEVARWLEQR